MIINLTNEETQLLTELLGYIPQQSEGYEYIASILSKLKGDTNISSQYDVKL